MVSKADVIPGMAHFAGTGPVGTRCDGCHYAEGHGRVEQSKGFGVLNPITCARWRELMGERSGKKQPSFSHANKSCKYFDRRRDGKLLSETI